VQRSSTEERVHKIHYNHIISSHSAETKKTEAKAQTFNGWFGSGCIVLLCPEKWDTAAVLHVGCIVRIGVKILHRRMERSSEHFGNNLLCFNIVRNVSLRQNVSDKPISFRKVVYQIIGTTLQEPCTRKVARTPSNYSDVDHSPVDGNSYFTI